MSDDPEPVFLYGALRSGTTLFRIILNHHPGLQNPGETDFLFDHIRPDESHPTGWRYDLAALKADRIFRARDIDLPADTDGRDLLGHMIRALAAKAPGRLVLTHHRHATRLRELFPQAPVLHLLRDPRDVARSSVGLGWAGNSFHGIGHWIDTERDWDAAAIPQARVLTVKFEDLMGDIEGELTRVCDFLGLPFDRAMLSYPDNSTYGPPDPKIAQQWKRKAGAREVARLEARAGDLLSARGYEPAGAPLVPGPIEAAALAIEHRAKRWRFNARRYGWGLFLARHAAAALGLKGATAKLDARQEAIRIAQLK